MPKICSDLFKTCLKIYYFCQHPTKAKKWPNGQTILFLANSFKKIQIRQIWPLKRPNGNPETAICNENERKQKYFFHFLKFQFNLINFVTTKIKFFKNDNNEQQYYFHYRILFSLQRMKKYKNMFCNLKSQYVKSKEIVYSLSNINV
jgi:hypothetical protein